MKGAFDDLKKFTGFNYIYSTPSNSLTTTVDDFFIKSLNNDNPVLMLNMLESIPLGLYYLINDTKQLTALGYKESPNFDNHWMTITKYFKNGNTGESYVAMSTWGDRISINTKLLRSTGLSSSTYYPSFYCYEITK